MESNLLKTLVVVFILIFTSCTKTTKFDLDIKEGDLFEYVVNIQSPSLGEHYTVTYETYILHETTEKYYAINRIKDIVANTEDINNTYINYPIPTFERQSSLYQDHTLTLINYSLLKFNPCKYLDTEVLLEINKNGEIRNVELPNESRDNEQILNLINIVSLLGLDVTDFDVDVPFGLSITQQISIDNEIPLMFASMGTLILADAQSNLGEINLETAINIKKKTKLDIIDPKLNIEEKKIMYSVYKLSKVETFINAALPKSSSRVCSEIEFKLRFSNYFRSFTINKLLNEHINYIDETSLESSFYGDDFQDFDLKTYHIDYPSSNTAEVEVEYNQGGFYGDYGVIGAFTVTSCKPDGSDFDSLALASLKCSDYSVNDLISIAKSDTCEEIHFTSKVHEVIYLSNINNLWFISDSKKETQSTKVDSLVF